MRKHLDAFFIQGSGFSGFRVQWVQGSVGSGFRVQVAASPPF